MRGTGVYIYPIVISRGLTLINVAVQIQNKTEPEYAY